MKQYSSLSPSSKQVVANYFCEKFEYHATLPDGTANPETPGQFVSRLAQEWIVRMALEQRAFDQSIAAAAVGGSDADLV